MITDLKHAVRALSKNPASTCIAVLSLALAIGSCAAAVSIANALFARDLHVSAPKELVAFAIIEPESPEDQKPLLMSEFEQIQRRAEDFAVVFAWKDALLRNLESNGGRYLGNVNEVSGEYFAAMGVQPLVGRLLSPRDVASSGSGQSARVAVLDYRCWQERFGGDPKVVGEILRVDGTALTIVGVTPRDFVGLNIVSAPDAVVPIGFETGRMPEPTTTDTYVAGRLKPGGSVTQAAAHLSAMWPAILEAAVPDKMQGAQRAQYLAKRIRLESLRTGTTGGSHLRQQLSRPLTILSALSALVLLVACVSLANLILLRATARRHELALRASLGARKLILVRAMALEGALLALAGAALGVIAAYWTSPILLRILLASQPLKPLIFDPRPDSRVLALGAALGLVIGIVCAAAPAWNVLRRDPASALLASSRVVRTSRGLLQKTLICVQIALALVLTSGALLFGRSLYNLHAQNPGFRINGMVQMHLFSQVKQQVIPNRTAYYRQVMDRLSEVPGVDAVSYAQPGPLIGIENIRPVSRPRVSGTVGAVVSFVGPQFFETMGMKVLAGREFEWNDDERAPHVAVISQSLANRLFPGTDPIGQIVDIPRYPFGAGLQIIGVVNSASLWRLQSRDPSAIYVALMQAPMFNNFLVELHTTGNLHATAQAADSALQSLGYQYSFLTESLTETRKYQLRNERAVSMISVFLAGLTTLLASVGLYGLLSYAATLRRREIAIRLAVGAQRRDILLMILREAASLTAVGLALGAFIAFVGIRLAADILFGVTPHDPFAFSAAVAVLAIISFGAAYLPARRTCRTDPLTALRGEDPA